MTKKVFKNSFIFVLGDILNKAVPLFMLPVLTRYLTPEDYGIISIFTVFVSILAVFTGLSVHGAINVNFFKLTKKELQVYIGNTLIILNISTLVVFIFVFLFSSYILEEIHLPEGWLYVAVILAFSQFLTVINLVLWTAEQKPKEYSIYQFSQTVITTSLSLILVVGFGMKWEGQLLAITSATILFSAISFIFIVKRGYLVFKPNKTYIKDALRFGIPLVPHSLAGWIGTSVDRMMIMSFFGSYATGLYTVGYQLGTIISVLTVAFNKAWTPYLMRILAEKPTLKNKKTLVYYTYIYFIAIIVITFIFSYLAQLAIPYFLDSSYTGSIEYILYIALSFAFNGMYFMVVNYIFYVNKTHILAFITFGVALFHMLILYILLKVNGTVGAAQAMMFASFISFLATWWFSNKVYKMPWNVWKSDV